MRIKSTTSCSRSKHRTLPGGRVAAAFVALLLLNGLAVPGAASVVIDFEHLPSLPTQPNNFAAAGPMQTYNSAGVFSISGGVVLGNPSGLAGFASAGSSPNTYGTTDAADPSLLSVMTLLLPASELVTNVSGVLFNGQPMSETYAVTAKSGGTSLSGQTLSNIPVSTSASDHAAFSISSTSALPITEVDFNAPADVSINGWDFFVDTISLTSGGAAVPEPSSGLLVLGGAAGLLAVLRRGAC